MHQTKKKGTWYGLLQSRKGDAILIWDPVFPAADKGKIWLYNTNYGFMVEYVEKILKPKVRGLTGKALQRAKDQYGPELMEIKSQYLEEVTDEGNPAGSVSEADKIVEVEPEVADDDMDFDDEFDEIEIQSCSED